MNTVNKTKPTNLSILYPDLPQTVQLEHFADLVQKLFHANDVVIYLHTLNGDCFVATVSSNEAEVLSLIALHNQNSEVPLSISNDGKALSNPVIIDNQSPVIARRFSTGDQLSGFLLLKPQFQVISEEQDAALQWMLDCIETYLSKTPIEKLSLDCRVCSSVDLERIADSVFTGFDNDISWFSTKTNQQIQLKQNDLLSVLGDDLSHWLKQQMTAGISPSTVRVKQDGNTASSLQLTWWKSSNDSWLLQVQNISLANQLRQTQQHLAFLQSLFTSGIAAMVGINQQHQIVYANMQARQLLQISQATDKLRAPLDLGYLQFYDPNHLQQGPISPFGEQDADWSSLTENRRLVQYPGGDEKVLSMWLAPHNDLQSPEIIAYCLLMDMTAQHQLQRALQDMQEHIDSLLHFSPAAIYQSFTNLSHGFMYISPNIEKITGFSQIEVMNDPSFWPRHVHPDDLALVLSEHLAEDHTIEYRLFNLHQQRYIWVKDIRNSSPEEGDEHIVFGALLDIHARKEAELEQERLRVELSNNKLELSQSLDSMVDAVITLNEHGALLSCNPATSTLFGFSLHELKTMTFTDLLVSPESFIRFFAEVTRNTSNPLEQRALEFSGKTKAGKTIYFSCTMAELPANTSLKRRFVACLHDLTEFKAQQEQLIQAGKLSALGTLTSGIAHDFNNILGIIRGYAEMLSLRTEPQVSNYALNIIKAADRGAAMTKNLLDFSSNKSRDIAKIDVNQLIGDMQDMLFEAVTKRITLDIQLTSEPLPTEMEKGGLENALLNLVINARHAITDEGNINITSQKVQLTQAQAGPLDLAPGFYCCVRVTDSGSGMSEEVQQRLFEPFFTTKGTQGTGLGLAQVFGFCRRCRGTVRVHSTLGVGTEFSLYFPYTENLIKLSQPEPLLTNRIATPIASSKVMKSAAKILLVDDEEELLSINSMLLESAGYDVVCINNMQGAINLLKQRQFDLVLSDIVMPNGTGLQLASYIQQHFPKLPVQLISGFADESMIEDEASRHFFDNRLQKPLKTSILLNKVAELVQNSNSKDNSHVSL